MSYVGAIISSLGIGTLIDHHGWRAAFALWIGCAVLGALLRHSGAHAAGRADQRACAARQA